mgnify:CR=1 FL=1
MPVKEDIKNDNELKKEYLKSYGDAIRAEKAIEDEIQQLRLDKMCPSVVIDDMPHGSGGCSDLSGYAAKVDELLGELHQSMEERIELRREIIRKIEAMQNETEKLVLRLKYIQGKTFEKIAVDLRYTYRHVTRLHGQALRNFKLS